MPKMESFHRGMVLKRSSKNETNWTRQKRICSNEI